MIHFRNFDQFKAHKPTFSEADCARAFDAVLVDPAAGFLQILQDLEWLKEVKNSLKHLKPTDKIGVVGTGGSILGTQAFLEALRPDQDRMFYLSNTEEWYFKKFTQNQKPEDIFWILISKSGETFETQAYIERMMKWSGDCQRPISQRAVVITQKNENEMHLWAVSKDIPTIGIPKNLSGRYSVLSPVGLVPALAMGLDIEKFISGAKKQIQKKESICKAATSFLASFEREEWITTQFCYSLKLRRLGDWWVQLWSESLAKKGAPRVSTPMVSVGSLDQHSLLQQYMDGAKDKYFVFLSYKTTNQIKNVSGQTFKFFKSLGSFSLNELLSAQLLGTQNAFSQNKISFATMEISDLSEEGLGAYFLFWELVVATIAQVLKIDAYNQPGVELGKRLASDLLLNPKVEPVGSQI